MRKGVVQPEQWGEGLNIYAQVPDVTDVSQEGEHVQLIITEKVLVYKGASIPACLNRYLSH